MHWTLHREEEYNLLSCTYCVPGTHKVLQVSFSLKVCLAWPKHQNSRFISNKNRFPEVRNLAKSRGVRIEPTPSTPQPELFLLWDYGSRALFKLIFEHICETLGFWFPRTQALEEPVKSVGYKNACLWSGGQSLPALFHPQLARRLLQRTGQSQSSLLVLEYTTDVGFLGPPCHQKTSFSSPSFILKHSGVAIWKQSKTREKRAFWVLCSAAIIHTKIR